MSYICDICKSARGEDKCYECLRRKEFEKLSKQLELAREGLDKIGHREEPESLTNGDQVLGYLKCCEDIILEARETLKKMDEVGSE